MDTLNPDNYPADAALNAYLALLGDDCTKVLSLDFSYIITHRNVADLLPWSGEQFLTSALVKTIFIPLRNSTTGSWALATIRRDDELVQVFNYRHLKRVFHPVLHKILNFATRLDVGNMKRFKVHERHDAQSAALQCEDAPIWMLYQAFVCATGREGPLVPSKPMDELRSIIGRSITTSTGIDLVPLQEINRDVPESSTMIPDANTTHRLCKKTSRLKHQLFHRILLALMPRLAMAINRQWQYAAGWTTFDD